MDFLRDFIRWGDSYCNTRRRRKAKRKFNRNVNVLRSIRVQCFFSVRSNCKSIGRKFFFSKEKFEKLQCHSTTINWFFFLYLFLQWMEWIFNIICSVWFLFFVSCHSSECAIYWLPPKKNEKISTRWVLKQKRTFLHRKKNNNTNT